MRIIGIPLPKYQRIRFRSGEDGVASGVPIVVSPIPIFDDIEGAIKMRGKSVDDIVASISMLSEEDLKSSRKSITELRDSLQWSEVARRIQERLK